ncbi:MAG TPA: ornithine carbamoyltransferase [Nitrosopumilaceae archaeon]|nr:ornithine carbamoyltransferase [Nitrosopumilaceae archaeon]
MKLKTKNLLTLSELSKKEFSQLIDFSIKLKKELKQGENKPLLKNKTLTMIFQKPSTRTRVSFEIAMFHLGGTAINLSTNDMQLSRGESIEDTAKTLSRYTDCIMARVYDHNLLEKLSEYSSVPVINGLSDSFHPCQILADFMTIKEKKKKLKGLKLAWIGDGNNVCNSMINGCALSEIKMSVATPKGFEPNRSVVNQAQKSTTIELTTDPLKAVKNADIVVTDTFASIHNLDPKRTKKFIPKFQVNSNLMKQAKKNAIFMHCLPAKRGSEVTSSVIDGTQSVVWDEAENRLHTQKALLVFLIHA